MPLVKVKEFKHYVRISGPDYIADHGIGEVFDEGLQKYVEVEVEYNGFDWVLVSPKKERVNGPVSTLRLVSPMNSDQQLPLP